MILLFPRWFPRWCPRWWTSECLYGIRTLPSKMWCLILLVSFLNLWKSFTAFTESCDFFTCCDLHRRHLLMTFIMRRSYFWLLLFILFLFLSGKWNLVPVSIWYSRKNLFLRFKGRIQVCFGDFATCHAYLIDGSQLRWNASFLYKCRVVSFYSDEIINMARSNCY